MKWYRAWSGNKTAGWIKSGVCFRLLRDREIIPLVKIEDVRVGDCALSTGAAFYVQGEVENIRPVTKIECIESESSPGELHFIMEYVSQ